MIQHKMDITKLLKYKKHFELEKLEFKLKS